jgi:type I restriction enzyme S subunit
VAYGITLNSKRSVLPLKKPYLRVANVQRDSFNLNDANLIGWTEKEAEQYRLKQGDILVLEEHADVNKIGRASL